MESTNSKTALVLEGGAMRGMYTAGVLDVFMDNNIKFDAVIGVSAGALFGVNLLSGQRGRVIRYNKIFNSNKNYLGIRPLLKTGNIVSTEYAYDLVPRKLDPFDDEAFMKSGIPFYAVVTNIRTGEPEYIQIKSVFKQMDVLRASGSMPVVSNPVRLGHGLYLDGAVTDSIPYEKMLEMGYDKVVVVLTKPADYVKKPMPGYMTSLYKKNYPKFEEKFRNRHIMYNGQIERLKELEKEGTAYVVRPSEHIQISKIEKNPDKLESLYQLGIKDSANFVKNYEKNEKLLLFY